MSSDERPLEPEDPPIRFTDKRKIDRAAGADDAAPAHPGTEPAVEPGDVPMVEASLLDERTADLQRVQAEYANYRRRAERDRLAAAELATGRVLTELLPVLDDLDRARSHGDLEAGPLKAVADKLDTALTKLGLTAFGEPGDEFDPSIHEAVMHGESADVTVPTCTQVLRPGYRHNERLLRPAMVGVSDPASDEMPEPAPVPDAASEPEASAEQADTEGRPND